MLIGFIYYKTKNLTSAVMIHMFINVFANFTRIIYVDLIDFKILIYHLIITSALILLSIQFVKNYKTLSSEKEKV
jgi:membrane protease YdiL (CAAX protease family)